MCFDNIRVSKKTFVRRCVMKMKKIRIVSKTRFVLFITVLLLGTVLLLTSALPADAAGENAGGGQTAYQTVEVQSGDTLWSIASAHVQEKRDIRPYIQEICRINHLQSGGDLTVGQTLHIPKTCK